jgi:quinoprotein glucose dehydrogenase
MAEATTSSISTPPPEVVDQAGYGAATVVTGLRIPWEMRFLPDGRVLVTEREGRIVIADIGTGQATEVGRIEVLAKGEGGLMGLALDPAFPATPRIYLSYTTNEGGWTRNRVSSFELAGMDGSPALGVETVLLDGIPAGNIHNGSRVIFDPDGYLWVTTGDAGNADLAQQMDSLAGKVLRMTSDGKPALDNPFAEEPYPLSLIYTLGHRNPQGLDFHPESGTAFITEHGTDENDEVNVLQPGGNYGWPEFRGQVGEEGYVDPIYTWTPTIAPAGAAFLFGLAPAGLEGTFVFVTLKQSDIRVLVPRDRAFSVVANEEVLFDEQFGRLRAIALGPDGALYVATSNQDGRGSRGSEDDRIIRIEAVD